MLTKIKFFVFSCITILILTNTNAQKTDTVKYFRYGGFSSLTFNQVSLSNWAAGGENALSATGIVNIFGNYRKEKIAWDNFIDLRYGFLKSGKQTPRKNEDKIEINSIFGYKALENLFYSTLFNYRTQFDKGYNYPNDTIVVSKFNAPGYLSLSFGLNYKPGNYFSVYISPVGGRLILVNDQALADSGAYGVDKAEKNAENVIIKHGKKSKLEFGATLNAMFQKDVFKNINVASKLTLFNNYTDKQTDNRKNIDVNWDVMINIKAGKYLITSIITNLIYDQNIIAKTQFKEAFGVGASYKF